MTVDAEAATRLKANREHYDRLVCVVRERAAGGDFEGTLRSATVAANFAWHAPVGMVNDPELERAVVGLASSGGRPQLHRGAVDGRVLHVLTEGYVIGGHTRLAYRWMLRDGRPSDIALTNQLTPTPTELQTAAASCGGRVYDLRAAAAHLSVRAAALRRLMNQAALVVLHVHPYDAVALAAANLPGPRPPIVFENHADHNYWLGLGAADIVMDHRAAAQELTRHMRGVAAHRVGLLPLPIDTPRPSVSRAEIRRRMRLGPEDVFGISVANASKMRPLWGEGFDRLLVPALEANPKLTVMLVGPTDAETWNSALSRFPGRMFHLGVKSDVSGLLAAADIYLDSFPVSSGTSILEAAAMGLPLLSLQPYEGPLTIFHANSPGLTGTGHDARTPEEYLKRLRELIMRPTLRHESGRRARQLVQRAHEGEQWNAALEELYARAFRVDAAASLDEYEQPAPDLEYNTRLVRFVQEPAATVDATNAAAVIGDIMDTQLVCDLYLSERGAAQTPLSVRIADGWENNPACMIRLIALAATHRQLAVSLPLVAGDDGSGTQSVQELTPLLAAAGVEADTCGDLSIDAATPVFAEPQVRGAMQLTAGNLDLLQHMATSRIWERSER
jgi:glycosyltransferase involved in cell wall biosynthesis